MDWKLRRSTLLVTRCSLPTSYPSPNAASGFLQHRKFAGYVPQFKFPVQFWNFALTSNIRPFTLASPDLPFKALIDGKTKLHCVQAGGYSGKESNGQLFY